MLQAHFLFMAMKVMKAMKATKAAAPAPAKKTMKALKVVDEQYCSFLFEIKPVQSISDFDKCFVVSCCLIVKVVV